MPRTVAVTHDQHRSSAAKVSEPAYVDLLQLWREIFAQPKYCEMVLAALLIIRVDQGTDRSAKNHRIF